MNVWTNEIHSFYGCNEPPYLRISVMDENKIIYSFALNSIKDYETCFGKQQDYITFNTPVINPKDYSVLVSKKYQKYLIEINQMMRNGETLKDELIEFPSKIFSNLELSYSANAMGEPVSWNFYFNNYST